MRWLPRIVVVLLSGITSGCATLGYYHQAFTGQLEIWRKAQSIDRVLAQSHLAPELRARLELAVAARTFAQEVLELPDNGSYHDYADLGRDYVVWNVFATPALSLEPVKSCFPLVGCLEYRGYFSESRAEQQAERQRARGLDVFVGGVAAFSTLGWFDDPVLNTILVRDEERIAEIVFHELAHQRVYLPGDSTFNESFAMAVGQTGVRLWLQSRGLADAHYVAAEARERAFIGLLLETRGQLETVYGGALPEAAKRAEKQRLLTALQAGYASLKASWGGDASYDSWMEQDLNNAKLASISTYHDHVGAFLAMVERYGGDFAAFYAAVERLAESDEDIREGCLTALSAATTPARGACAAVLP